MELEIITREPKSRLFKNPILFVHGMYHSAWCWQQYYMPYFVDHGFVCHAVSLRGHGNSDNEKSLRTTSIDDFVADVARVAGSLPEETILTGHSMGGMVIQKYLEHNTARAAVLLAATPVDGLIGTTVRFFKRHPLLMLKMILTMSLYPAIETHDLCKEMFFSADMPEPVANAYFSRMQDESYLAYLELLGFKLPKPKKLDVPLLVLGAENDMAFTPAEILKTAAAYGVQAEIFNNISHDMMLDRNWLDAADRILNWMYGLQIDRASADTSYDLFKSNVKYTINPFGICQLV